MSKLLYGPNRVVETPNEVAGGLPAANDATAKNVLGTIVEYKGNKWMYVKFDNGTGNVAAVAHGVAYWKSLDPLTETFTVTSDETDSHAGLNGVAGIFGCAITDGYYGWIQISGVATCLVAASTVAGDRMIGYATDLTFNRIATGGAATDNIYGVAINAIDSNGTSEVLLQSLDWGGRE